ncbi:MAG TPA: hypothetical protein VJQ83_00860 [Tepidiformaceae bacterium]|nr:hypothetical protein [Tepidiformaceae bacterium]
MAAPVSPQVLPDDAVVITLLGRKYVFANRDEAREWMNRPMSGEEREQMRRASAGFDRLRQRILDDTNGRGITTRDIDDALEEARDH